MAPVTTSIPACRRCGRLAPTATTTHPYGSRCAARIEAAATLLAMSRHAPARNAAVLLRAGALHAIPSQPGTWAAQSQRVVNLTYITTTATCSCPYSQHNPNSYCKHRIAAIILKGEVAE